MDMLSQLYSFILLTLYNQSQIKIGLENREYQAIKKVTAAQMVCTIWTKGRRTVLVVCDSVWQFWEF